MLIQAKGPVSFDIAKVIKTYSGKAGACCCGCSGTYRVASAHRAAAEKQQGYKLDEADVSDRSVKLICSKIMKADAVVIDDTYINATIGERWYTAYFAR